ncbi:unnamed protein product [Heterobilharzia americana]|nr:unnamed protein product [Heterobilharzia americana]
MRERKRRRSTLVGLVDITNIIESPPVDFNSDQGLRRSRRLQHKSLCTSEFESPSHKELFSRSSTSRRKSLRCQQKQLNTDNRTSNIPQPTSQIECDMSVRDIN